MRTRLSDFGADVQVRMLSRQLLTATDYGLGIRARRVLADRYRAIFHEVEVLVGPTSLRPAQSIADSDDTDLAIPRITGDIYGPNTRPLNVTGLPAISVPAGFTAAGAPVGLQLIGHAFDEVTILRAAAAFESATEWHL